MAKKGTTAHHFAHKAESGCTYQPETALHQYAKRLLASQPVFQLPKLLVVVSNPEFGIELREEIPSRMVTVDAAYEEVPFQDVVPDVQFEVKNERIFAEVAVTHFVDRDKRAKLRRIAVPAVEIDLSSLQLDSPLEVIDTAVLPDATRKKWAYHPLEAEIRSRLTQKLAEKIQQIEQASYSQSVFNNDYFSDTEDEFSDTEDEEGRLLLEQAKRYTDDISLIDKALREAASRERGAIYASMSDLDKLVYHCFLLKCSSRCLPAFLKRINVDISAFRCPSVVWRTGIFVRFVASSQHVFSLGHVAAWCQGRYSVSAFGGDFPQSEPSNWQLTNTESEIFNFLAELESGGYLESDGFIAKRREFKPTGRKLPIGQHQDW